MLSSIFWHKRAPITGGYASYYNIRSGGASLFSEISLHTDFLETLITLDNNIFGAWDLSIISI